ncbi:MAG: TetR/AcrR family transcriptional regulator [Alphaproteobacteria bacterium]|nr:TetR/AcrR family transcriptional regulator [Alphaproteobacteria bacterium]
MPTPKPKTRRTQKERRREAQAAILAASMDLLIEQGYAGFSASKVAARAKVSRGAQEHYYPKKVDLIAAVTQHAMTEAVEHARALAATVHGASDPISKFLQDSKHFFLTPTFRTMIEVMIAARADRRLARVIHPIAEDARRTLNGIWTDTLDAAGYPRATARRFIELTHYLMRGVFLVDTWLPYRIDRDAVVETWRRLAPGILQAAPARRRAKQR